MDRKQKRAKRRQRQRALRAAWSKKRPPPDLPGFPRIPTAIDDALVANPDMLKYAYATWCSRHPKLGSRMRDLEARLGKGPLHALPSIDHWAMEEYFWHGHPHDSHHPIDRFLSKRGQQLSQAAREQIQDWKRAELGVWLIEGGSGRALSVRRWDHLAGETYGPTIDAIDLSIGGAAMLASRAGSLHVSYLAPWPTKSASHSFLGYGATFQSHDLGAAELLLGLRHVREAIQPLPWLLGREERHKQREAWRRRDWQRWLGERLQFPCRLLLTEEGKRPEVVEAAGMLDIPPARARKMGVYLEVASPSTGVKLAGVSNFIPLDITHPSWLPIVEYKEYRELVGPPPGVPLDMTHFTID